MIVLMAGQIASGKTSVATGLAEDLPARLIKARDALSDMVAATGGDRHDLQVAGADLDRRTNGRWLLEYVEAQLDVHANVVVDSLRTRRQTVPILEDLVGSRLVYLRVSEATRRNRYALAAASDDIKRATVFDEAMRHPTETGVPELIPLAHLAIDSDDLTVAQTVEIALEALHSDGS